MKLKFKQLRSIINLALNEAPLYDVLPFTKHPETQDHFEGEEQRLKKFYTSPKFHNDAVRLFSNFDMPVYIIPAYVNDLQQWNIPNMKRLGLRITLIRTPTAEDIQKVTEISIEKAKQIEQIVKSGGCVFVVKATMLEKGFLPTPWMMVHAMFDNTRPEFFFKNYKKLLELIKSAGLNDPKIFAKLLTMKSARDNMLNAPNDVAPEILCQAILTANGFSFNRTENETQNEILEQISTLVKDARAEFQTACQGVMFFVIAIAQEY